MRTIKRQCKMLNNVLGSDDLAFVFMHSLKWLDITTTRAFFDPALTDLTRFEWFGRSAGSAQFQYLLLFSVAVFVRFV